MFKGNFNEVYDQISQNWPQENQEEHEPISQEGPTPASEPTPVENIPEVHTADAEAPQPTEQHTPEIPNAQLLTERIAQAPFDVNTHTIMHNGTSNRAYVFHYSPNVGERTLRAWDLSNNTMRPSGLNTLFTERPTLTIHLLQHNNHGSYRQVVRPGSRYFNMPEGELPEHEHHE
jgi:hypothetical protein